MYRIKYLRPTQHPHAPCIEIAPTGSSILSLSNILAETTVKIPPMAPVNTASHGLMTAQPEVIDTKPPNTLFTIVLTSYFLLNRITLQE